MENIQYITLDIMNNKVNNFIYTKQYDVGREVVFSFTDNGSPISLSGMSVIFTMKKPDGKYITYSGSENMTKTSSTVTLTFTEQMTVLYGKLPYQISLVDGTPNEVEEGAAKIISTVNGYIICDKAAVQKSDLISTSDGSYSVDVTTSHASAQAAVEAASDSADYAKISKSYAVGGTDYWHGDISDEHDNAKYYFESMGEMYGKLFGTIRVVLRQSGWVGDTQTVSCRGVLEDEDKQLVVVRPLASTTPEYVDCGIACVRQGNNELTFRCLEVPQHDLEIYVMLQAALRPFDDFLGADGSNAGESGLVPAPSATDNVKFLKGDGTWDIPPNGTVIQTNDSSSFDDFRVLFSNTPDNTNRNESTKKSVNLTFNPRESHLTVGSGLVLHAPEPQIAVVNETSQYARQLSVLSRDIELSGDVNTWDGTNTSLRAAIVTARNTVVQTPLETPVDEQYYEILLSGSRDNFSHTEGVNKTNGLIYKPYGSRLYMSDQSNSDYHSYISPYIWNLSSDREEPIMFVGQNSTYLSIKPTDIILSGGNNTWDGVNTSLKTTLASIVTTSNSVVQTETSNVSGTYELLFSYTEGDTSKIEGARKSSAITFNPSTKILTIDGKTSSSELKMTMITPTSVSVNSSVNSAHGLALLHNDLAFSRSNPQDTDSTWDGTNTSLKNAITALSDRITALGG